jgi:hypothetical protein
MRAVWLLVAFVFSVIVDARGYPHSVKELSDVTFKETVTNSGTDGKRNEKLNTNHSVL